MKKMLNFFLFSFIIIVLSFPAYAQNPKVDIIFVIDTSGSMNDEGNSLYTALVEMQRDLQQLYDLNTQVWAITEKGYDGYTYSAFYSPFNWITTSVEKEIPNATVDWDEDWGPAVYDIATKYKRWRADAVKIVVPISDEGPENGNPVERDDKNIIIKASRAAQNADIYVLPVVGSGASQDVKDLANVLGSGTYFDTVAGTFTPEKMEEAINKILAITTGQHVFYPTNLSYWLLKNGARMTWQGAEGANYYKYNLYVNNNLVSHNITTKPLIDIPSQGKNCNIKVAVSACNDVTSQCSDYSKINFNLPADNSYNILSNPVKTKEYFQAFDNNDYIYENPSKQLAQVAEPVDISTGSFNYSHTDMVIPAPGIPFIVKRYYNSISYKKGWYFTFNNSLDTSNTSNIKVYWGDKGRGGINTFIKAAGGEYVSKYGTDKLYIEGGNYVIEKPYGLKYVFDINGKEIAIKNKKGLGIQFDYPNANTILVKDTFGNILATISLNIDGQIESITDSNGNSISYIYNINGDIDSFINRDGQTTTYEYDSNGYLSKIIGPDGYAYVENIYDSEGRVIEQKDGSGHVTTFSYIFDPINSNVIDEATVTYPNGITASYDVSLGFVTRESLDSVSIEYKYDINNKIIAITDANGETWHFKRNNIGLITEAIDPTGNKYIYSYDSYNNLVSIRNPLNNEIKFKYDTNNNLTKIIYPNSNNITIEYDVNNLPVRLTDASGNVTQYTYNKRGFISSIILPNKGEIKYTYDNIGDIISVINPIGNKTFYKYNKNGKIICITDALGHETKFSYDAYGDLIKITDPKGRTIKAEYNSDGLLTKLILPDNSTIENTYDALGRIIETKDTLGRVTKREYDNFGRLSKIITPKGNTLTFVYDKVGNLTDIIDSKGNSVKMEYDNLYRLVKSYDAYGNLISQIDYNVIGLPTKISDADGKTLEFFYDSLNRLKQATLAGSITARAEYNALGRIAKLIDPKGYETKYNYNNIGELIRETNPLGNSWTYNYDLAGKLIKSSLPDGTKVTYTYDAINRLSQIEFQKDNKSKYVYYSYDKIGNLLSVEDNVGDIRYNYDSMNRVVQRKDIFGNIVRYQYDPAGRLIKLIYPDGKAITYSYDADNNLIQIKDFKGNITQFKYDEDDNLIKTIYPNGYYTVYTYDDNNRLTSIKNYNPNGVEVTGDELIKDKSGNIISLKKTEYIEPNFSRIKSFNFTVNQFNQIIKSNEGLFNYDKKGNLLSYVYNGKKITLKYDIVNRLVEADIDNHIYTYKYDAEGNRIEVTKNGKTTRYIIDNVMGLLKPIAEVDSLNNIRRYYIWGNNGLIYSIDPHGRLYIYLYNYRGDTTAVVDNTGKVIAAYTYSAYGKILNEYGKISNPFKFLGKYGVMSDNNNLYYIRARYYSPDLGRFVQVDLVNLKVPLPLFINRYTYASGNPLSYIDVNGKFLNIIAGAAIGGLIGGGVELFNQVVFQHKDIRNVDWADVGVAAAGGAVAGAIESTGIGAAIPARGITEGARATLGAAITGGFAGFTGSVVKSVSSDLLQRKNPFTWQTLHEGIIGAAMGGVTGGLFEGIHVACIGGDKAWEETIANIGIRSETSIIKRFATAWTKAQEYGFNKWEAIGKVEIRTGFFRDILVNTASNLIELDSNLIELDYEAYEKEYKLSPSHEINKRKVFGGFGGGAI